MVDDNLPPSLQESILAALVFDEKSGAAIAAQVLPKHFDDTYRTIAERVLEYRRKYGRPPGRAHLDDLFGKVLQEGRMPRLRRLLFGLSELAEGLNGEYVVGQTQTFVRGQQLKAALIEANARYEQGGEGLAPDIERIFSSALRHRTQTLDAGTFLNDTARSLRFMEYGATPGYSLGIPELDRIGIALIPKEMLLYIAPKGTGKSWLAVHAGKQALLQRAKVLHISLEMNEDRVAGRYFQSLFGAAIRPDKFDRTVLEFDRLGRVSGFKTRKIAPRWDFASPGARRELKKKIQPWGTRFGRLVIKAFPSGSLTMNQLEGYLDYLEMSHKFIPQVLIVDYPDLMAQDKNNLRISIGRTFVDLRGLFAERNLAGFTPTQGNRSSLNAKRVTGAMVAEDASKLMTADNSLTYSQTEAEKLRGLARLRVEYARNGESGATIIITQSYATGQYVLQSARMQQAYWDRMNEVAGDDEE